MTVNEMNDGTCKNYDTDKNESYGQCMDTYLADLYKPELGCVPPWMSNKDQCKGKSKLFKEAQIKFYPLLCCKTQCIH